jgi:hypothetical protein
MEGTRRLRHVLPTSSTTIYGLVENPGADRRITAPATLLDETGAGTRIMMIPSMMYSSLPLGVASDPAGDTGHYTHMLPTSFQQMQQQQQQQQYLTNPGHPCVVDGTSVPTWMLQHRPADSSSGLLTAAAVHPSSRSSLLLSNNADQDCSFNLESIRNMYDHNAAANQENQQLSSPRMIPTARLRLVGTRSMQTSSVGSATAIGVSTTFR